MPLIPVLREAELCEFQASLVYWVSSPTLFQKPNDKQQKNPLL